MSRTKLLMEKLKKEAEIIKLQLEILEIEAQLTGKDYSKKIAKLKQLRGDNCYEYAVLERQLQMEEEANINVT